MSHPKQLLCRVSCLRYSFTACEVRPPITTYAAYHQPLCVGQRPSLRGRLTFPASSAKNMVSKTVSSPKTQSLPITGKTMERASYSYGSVAGGIPRIMLPDQDFRSPPSVASQRSITNTHWRALYMKASITKALKTHRMDCAVLRQDHGG